MTLIPIPDQRDTTVKVWRDDSPAPAVIVHNDAWGQELHLPVEVAREVAAAILATVTN